MLKVFIADDDQIIRKGIRTIIEKNALDFFVIGDAKDGLEALNLIKTLNPDLLITDIKMPVMDGIELIKSLNELKHKTKVIVLSGFDEYAFVRETLKNGVIDYLLKPVKKSELLELINKVKEQISIEQLNEDSAKITEGILAESAPLYKEKLLKDLIKGNSTEPQDYYLKKLEKYGAGSFSEFVMAVINIDDGYKLRKRLFDGKTFKLNDMLKQQVICIAREKSIESRVIVSEHNDNVVVFFTGSSSDNQILLHEVNEIINEIRGNIVLDSGFTFTAGLSNIQGHLDKVQIAYFQAEIALNERFYQGQGSTFVFHSEKYNFGCIKENQVEELYNILKKYVEIGEPTQAKTAINRILDKLCESRPEPLKFRELLILMVKRLCLEVSDFKAVEEEISKECGVILLIDTLDTYSEIKGQVPDLIYNIIESIRIVRSERSRKIIETAKEYIRQHLSEDISLKLIADIVHFNPSYFSDYFKNETGGNFMDFLMETRINEAKKYLCQPEIKIYEVGYLVGYNDPTAFNRVFKKLVGISPSEYKKIVN